MNGHFSAVGDGPGTEKFDHGIQVIDEDKTYNSNLISYLRQTDVADAGFNYHLISVFGSQSTGKSTLLNTLFGTHFSVMSESERRQTTKGIWLSKNKRETGGAGDAKVKMADNILVMDVEGTDGRERGEDQDFERKSALFALATSEVLIVNIWEHQVGLYQGANMGLLKTVFEVNLQLFLKDKHSNPRSLLFFVIRDHIGHTPLANLRTTLIQDLTKIWSSISKPQGLENSRIEDYFDFAFAALPHKVLQADKFDVEVNNLGARFVAGNSSAKDGSHGDHELNGGVFLPEYHRRIPADGFSAYAEGVWDQIVNNKDLDLPTQQELLAQFRCDEISREVLVAFDDTITPLEERQAEGVRAGKPTVLENLGESCRTARGRCVKNFEVQAGRYHKGVYARKRSDLEAKIDSRLKTLYLGQLTSCHNYDFAEIVAQEKERVLEVFKEEAKALAIEGLPWTNFKSQYLIFERELDEVSSKLRKEELRRLATRVERWVKSRLGDSVGLEFSKLGSGRAGAGAPEETTEKPPAEKDLWDRIWSVFVDIVDEAQTRFTDRARSFEASAEEVEVGRWRLRRKSWVALRERIDEEVMEGNILLKLRENFEDKFRYDEAGPRSAEAGDEEDLAPIGGVDEEEGKSLEEEMTILSESKRQDLVIRFKKTADGVYVEAKRGAIGGVAQVPWYFYGLLLALGWNEIFMVLRNPFLFLLLIIIAGGTYIAYTLNLLGPMMQMANAAAGQGVELGKQRLRDFLENSETARQALSMPARPGQGEGQNLLRDRESADDISLDTLDSRGRGGRRLSRTMISE
ncbi:unnamed protein product [Parascedosporium putredinis]|uniref:GB1/RHD3-type G domain-containing protein n=1 Tax=Parascedosporium putredinis TaxID=1442378 RepID=A0A9P1GXR6_9PEZI|nr:unnamed protein product [Parascedosporium putredinis]CAI7989304.1 unnamed protein product [Parascedosporium putredinis]